MSDKPTPSARTIETLWIASDGQPLLVEIVGYERRYQTASYGVTGYWYRLADGRISFRRHAFATRDEAANLIAEIDEAYDL